MEKRLREILQKAKTYYLKEKIHKSIPVSELCKNLEITKKEYDEYFG